MGDSSINTSTKGGLTDEVKQYSVSTEDKYQPSESVVSTWLAEYSVLYRRNKVPDRCTVA